MPSLCGWTSGGLAAEFEARREEIESTASRKHDASERPPIIKIEHRAVFIARREPAGRANADARWTEEASS
jgi:hypothetical protein